MQDQGCCVVGEEALRAGVVVGRDSWRGEGRLRSCYRCHVRRRPENARPEVLHMVVAPGETYPWAHWSVLRSCAQLLGDLFYWRKVACGAFRERIQDDLGTPVKSVVFTGEKRACSGLG